MNTVKLIVIPDDGDLLSAKKLIRKSMNGTDTIVDFNGDDEENNPSFAWREIKQGRVDFDVDTKHENDYKIILRAHTFLQSHKRHTKNDWQNVIVNSPIGDITEQVKNFEYAKFPDWFSGTGDSHCKTYFYAGHYSFAPRTVPTQYRKDDKVIGYQITGTSWNAISWYAVQRFSSDNPGFTIILKMDYSFTNSTHCIDDDSFEFIRSDKEIWKTLTNGNSFHYKGISIQESQLSNMTPVMRISCKVNAGVFLDKTAKIVANEENNFNSRGVGRHPENPWNALPEHVIINDNGEFSLHQPEGAGPTRDQNYSPVATGGASTHPLGEQEDSDSEETPTSHRSDQVELPESQWHPLLPTTSEYSNGLVELARDIRRQIMRNRD